MEILSVKYCGECPFCDYQDDQGLSWCKRGGFIKIDLLNIGISENEFPKEIPKECPLILNAILIQVEIGI